MSQAQSGDLAAAKELLDSHKKQARQERRRKNFDLIWQALEDMRKDGFRTFPVSEVGRRSGKLGGPKIQTIRNSDGEPFREVIGLYSAAFPKAATRGVEPSVERALATVANASARKILADKLQEAKTVERQRDQLRAAFASLSATPVPLSEPSAPSTLSALDLDALHCNFNPSRLAERGLAIAEDGAARDESGVVFLTADALGAIRLVLRQHGRQGWPGES